jgi:hypothetical protein
LLPILYGFHSRCPQVASIKNIALILDSDIFLEPFQDFGPDYPRCERLLFVCVEEREKTYLFIFWVILLHRWAGIHHPSCIQHTSSRNLLIILVLTILGEIYTYIYVVVIVLGLGIWYIKEEKIVRDLFKYFGLLDLQELMNLMVFHIYICVLDGG